MIERVLPLQNFLKNYQDQCKNNEFYSAVWLPTTNQAVEFKANRSERPKQTKMRSYRFSKKIIFANYISQTIFKNLQLLKNYKESISIDRSYNILSPIKSKPFQVLLARKLFNQPVEAEFSIPFENTEVVIEELLELFKSLNYYPQIPLGVRPCPKEDYLLSPCYGRKSTWISTFVKQDAKLLDCIKEIMMKHSARSHWGKFTLPGAYLKKQYPGWNEFKKERQVHDPHQIFKNKFLIDLGLTD